MLYLSNNDIEHMAQSFRYGARIYITLLSHVLGIVVGGGEGGHAGAPGQDQITRTLCAVRGGLRQCGRNIHETLYMVVHA